MKPSRVQAEDKLELMHQTNPDLMLDLIDEITLHGLWRKLSVARAKSSNRRETTLAFSSELRLKPS